MDRKNTRIDFVDGMKLKIPNVHIQRIVMPSVEINRNQRRLVLKKVA